VGEEALGVAQEGALALRAQQLLEERQGKDLGVREPLGRLVGSPVGVEVSVGIVDEAEKRGHSLFNGGEGEGMLRLGHPRFPSPGIRMAPVLQANHATLI
jgi:hypothetical protein